VLLGAGGFSGKYKEEVGLYFNLKGVVEEGGSGKVEFSL